MVKGDEKSMRKKIKVIVIVFGMLVLALLTIPVFATTITTVSFGLGTNPEPLWTVRWFYDKHITVFSGLNYYLQLDPQNGTFAGWIRTTNGDQLKGYGYYTIQNNVITGQWYLSDGYSGWISGHIGI